LIEAVIALLVVGILVGGLISLYVQSAVRAEWSAYSLAGQMMAIRGLEQTRSAKWDPLAPAPVDELVASNFPPVVDILDVGPGGGGITYATNVTSIQTISATPRLKAIRVDCTWKFPRRSVCTNTIFIYRGPDQ
jgi:Tfp pilus assembly protein PilV